MGTESTFIEKLDRFSRQIHLGSLRNVLYILLTVIPIAILVGIPLLFFVWGSFWTTAPGLPGGSFTIKGYIQVLNHPLGIEAIINTLIMAVGGTALSLVLGVLFMVYGLKTNGIGRKIVAPILIVQYLLPSYIAALTWEFYLGPRNGVVNKLAMSLPFINDPVFNIYSLEGIILVGATHYAGLVYLLTSGGIKAMPADLEEIGWVSGASLTDIMRKITLPLVLPGLAISTVLIFTRFMQSFGLPIILGFPEEIYVIATLMYAAVSGIDPNFTFAAALGIFLLLVTLAGLFYQRRLTGVNEKYERLSGSGGSESMRFDLGKYRYPVSASVIGLVLSLYVAPYTILFMSSFQQAFVGFNFERVTWTFTHYESLFVGSWSQTFFTSIQNTILIAVLAGLAGMVLSTLCSYVMIKTDSSVGNLLDYLTLSPSAIPGIIFGTALLWLFVTFNPFGLYGSIWVLIFAFSGKFLVYGTRAVNSSFRAIDQELEDAATVSGSGIYGLFRRIFAPLIKPGFFAGFTIYVIDTTKSLTIPILLSTGGSEMIQVFLFRATEIAETGLVAATSVVMIVSIFAIYGAVHFFTDIDITSL